ncbi:MAG: hypothetical protein Rubg2KO_28280 [Rubricoccaceae bacterium]
MVDPAEAYYFEVGAYAQCIEPRRVIDEGYASIVTDEPTLWSPVDTGFDKSVARDAVEEE